LSRINERRKLAQAEPSAEYAHKRATLLEAAARVFQAKGFDGASINDVAAESGTDRATVYYYFAGKRELFQSVIADAVESNVAAAEQIAAGEGGAAAKVRELVTALLQSYEEHYPYLFVYIQEDMAKLGRDGKESTRRLRDLGRRYNSAVEAIIQAGVESGEFKPGLDPRLASYAILGAVNWTHRWFRPGRGPSGIQIAEAFVDIILTGLVTAGASMSAPVDPGPAASALDKDR